MKGGGAGPVIPGMKGAFGNELGIFIPYIAGGGGGGGIYTKGSS